MKRSLYLSLGTGVAVLALASLAQGQLKGGSAAADKLGQAAQLLDAGQPQAARALLATINESDTNHAVAAYYDALALDALKDKRAFLKAVEAVDPKAAGLSAVQQEDLEYKQIDALWYGREFDLLATKTRSFRQNHPKSDKMEGLKEYELAGLFEQGMKKTYQACLLTDQVQYNAHWDAGRSNLESFLQQASGFAGTNYEVVQKHILREDIWVARMTLGDEANVLAEVPAEDQEHVRLLAIKLYQKLQPKDVEANLARMGRFLADYPGSASQKRVAFDMASIGFSRGEACSRAADLAEAMGDMTTAAAKRKAAREYYDLTRNLQRDLVVDATAGIDANDVFDRQDDLLNSYYLEKDYGRLMQLASQLTVAAKPGELTWLMGKDYGGIALQATDPPDLKGAAADFDEVLKFNFDGHAAHDHQLLVAAKWRMYVAHRGGDERKVAQIFHRVEDSQCNTNQRTVFLKNYSMAVGGR